MIEPGEIKGLIQQVKDAANGLLTSSATARDKCESNMNALGGHTNALNYQAAMNLLEPLQGMAQEADQKADEAMTQIDQAAALTSSGGGTSAPPSVRHTNGYPTGKPHPISWSDLYHVVNGDDDDDRKGGHAYGTGRPDKTEFPKGWGDDDIRDALKAVATRPDTTELKRGGNFIATGIHRGVVTKAVVRPDGSIAAGWPVEGPGVKRNPPRRRS